jgi:Chitobiase/beta-hexosaminidase C-terminal domain
VTISDATPQAFIYYTTDGSTPTRFSTVYTNPITVASSEKLQAVAIANFDTASALASASYTLNLPPPGFSIAGPNIQIVAGATAGNTSAITITPTGGFTGVVNLSCAITPTAVSDPATCVIPPSVTIADTTAQQVMLIVNTTAASTAHNPVSDSFHRMASASALACVLLVGIRTRRHRWRVMIGIAVLLSCIAAGPCGCGGGGGSSSGSVTSGGGGGQVNPGTTRGTYNVTVTGASGATKQTATISLTLE